jgi:hypothetical protein
MVFEKSHAPTQLTTQTPRNIACGAATPKQLEPHDIGRPPPSLVRDFRTERRHAVRPQLRLWRSSQYRDFNSDSLL